MHLKYLVSLFISSVLICAGCTTHRNNNMTLVRTFVPLHTQQNKDEREVS
jgi:hypothetical protein